MSQVIDQEQKLEIIRHSTAHLLAQAVKRLFPSALVTIGPVIEDGFYYDFRYERAFTPEDLDLIEAEMRRIVKENLPIKRIMLDKKAAINFFKTQGEYYKVEIIEGLTEVEQVSLYEQGEFTDLCRGPHVARTGELTAFKLTKLSGAYWRGDSKNEVLQRIYGTAWANKQDLEAYLKRIEEAKKRDHRKIGKDLDLFHLQEEAPGMIFWHPRGWTLYQAIEQYMRGVFKANGYQEVRTPQIVENTLWEKSGHWEKFIDVMYTTHYEERVFAVKPMNCPCHILVFNQKKHSYKELPLRLAEFGCCHRMEPSGTLHGLMRVRNFTQDDAHIFCTPDQIEAEVRNFHALLLSVYRDFGFSDISVGLSTRPEKRIGDDKVWDHAEAVLGKVLTDAGINWKIHPGEGAFYGPKIEYHFRDCLNRSWQLGTLQLDFSMPERLGAAYIAEDGSAQVPVMLHRAILGSLERFIGILLEHHAGLLPTWLAPVQVAVLNISERQAEYANLVQQNLVQAGLRSYLDIRNEKVGYKIREHTLQKIPYLLIIGDQEVEAEVVSVRNIHGRNLGVMKITDFIALLSTEISQHQKVEE